MGFEPVNRYAAETETVFCIIRLLYQNLVDNSTILGHASVEYLIVIGCFAAFSHQILL